MVTFVEAPIFSKHVHDYLSDGEYADFQLYLATNPDSGDIVQGSGGIRKVRWQQRGRGKSGGVRIMYFARTAAGEIWLLLIYAKSATDSIPGHILKALKEEMEHVSR
ncbi:MAG: transcriptional regulator [Desulfuromonadales bacterium]